MRVKQQGAICRQSAIWQQIRKLKTFTRHELDLAISRNHRGQISEASVNKFLMCLRRGGYLTNTPATTGPSKHDRWQLVQDTGLEPPRLKDDGTPQTKALPREQMWRTIKIIKEFSVTDLIAAASTGQCAITAYTASYYINGLCRAGYLVCLQRPRRYPQQPGRWRLVPTRNTGRYAPQVFRDGRVYDANLQRTFKPVTLEEKTPAGANQ